MPDIVGYKAFARKKVKVKKKRKAARTPEEIVYDLIRELDSGEGVTIEEIQTALESNGLHMTEAQIDDCTFELAYEGKLYQPRPERYKVL